MTKAGEAAAFVLMPWRGVWRVTFAGAFFGDYRSELNALESIAEAQSKLAVAAKIVRAEERRL